MEYQKRNIVKAVSITLYIPLMVKRMKYATSGEGMAVTLDVTGKIRFQGSDGLMKIVGIKTNPTCGISGVPFRFQFTLLELISKN